MIIYLYIAVYTSIPDSITLVEGKSISYPFQKFITMSLEKNSVKVSNNSILPIGSGIENAKLSLFGIIPLKTVNINVISTNTLFAGGNVIGMKMQLEGLVVVSLEGFTTREYKKAEPYLGKNIQRGDTIVSLNNKKVESAEEFIEAIQKSKGALVTLGIIRNGNLFSEVINAEIDRNDGKYKLGLWVKDSASGVGTVTFINPKNNEFGALGHGVNDIDGNGLLNISTGRAYDAVILSVNRGKKGAPGELHGAMRGEDVIADIKKNTRCGVFGIIKSNIDMDKNQYEIGLKSEIVPGSAVILSTVSGNKCEEYNIKIEKVNYNNEVDSKDMVIRVTDKRLIEKTGGIVQGMSGSPIIQNGKIVGAVTHVLINDPTRGYGIFIENMLEEAS